MLQGMLWWSGMCRTTLMRAWALGLAGLLGVGIVHVGAGAQGRPKLVARGEEGHIEGLEQVDATGSAPALSNPRRVVVGEIPWALWQRALDAGIGRFLQKIQVEPSLRQGRFAGWRVLRVQPPPQPLGLRGLEADDVVRAVNGRTLERPEDLHALWSRLRTAEELAIELERDGRLLVLVYRVVGSAPRLAQ